MMTVMWVGFEVRFSEPYEAAVRALKEPALPSFNDV
jgi:hypothetical protein